MLMVKLLCLALVLAGCGGQDSPWKGKYSGTWEDYRGITSFSGSVDASGALRWELGDGRAVSGNVPLSGECTVVVRHPRQTARGFVFQGKLEYQDGSGAVVVVFD